MSEHITKIDMCGICKSYGGVHALKDVNLNVRKGEIHALVGENGAGKSTLIGILAGSKMRDEGAIIIDGKPAEIKTPQQGIESGISVIYQELALVGALTVAENIFIDEYRKGSPFINWKSLRARAKQTLERLGFAHIDVNDRVQNLRVAYQQVVEICKALARNSSVLVLDEPTSVLASAEVEQLLNLLIDLKNQGVAIIYISHRLDEIFRIADRMTVLKDGRYVDTLEAAETNQELLVSKMIGRSLENYYPARAHREPGEVLLKVENVKSGARVKDVSFEVRRGEVLGFSGLVGSGRTEAVRAIFGDADLDGGTIYVKGQKVNIKSPKQAVRHDIGLLPEDRKTEGVILNLSIRNNITLGALKKFSNAIGWINHVKEDEYLHNVVKDLTIKLPSLNHPVASLSGGNQQKVSVAKLLALDTEILILDEPTRGVDVGAKVEIFNIINALAARDYAIIMISSEMNEILGMCDRAIVFREGRTVAEFEKSEITEQSLINSSMGVTSSGRQ